MVGVWGRAGLLVGLVFAFLAAAPGAGRWWRPGSGRRGAAVPDGRIIRRDRRLAGVQTIADPSRDPEVGAIP
jgi:hypothetical protein